METKQSGITKESFVQKYFTGATAREKLTDTGKTFGLSVVAFSVFLMLWSIGASRVQTSLGELPGPIAVFGEAGNLWKDYKVEREKKAAFYAKQEQKNEIKLAADKNADVKVRQYTGKPTYPDQIVTSLKTVFIGFLIASIVALPIGVFCGLSKTVMTALSPLIQILKPVSPLAWLPIVTMVVSALYVTTDAMFEKSFIISAITVALCSLWATLINTALGVASVDKDYINVAKVLKLSLSDRIFKIMLPASLPLIFAGLRISLGIGWMVLIAAEMLAQNPGLGKFVWDEFQNGSSQSLAKIMVAVLTIGIIGYMLDKIMLILQQLVSFEKR